MLNVRIRKQTIVTIIYKSQENKGTLNGSKQTVQATNTKAIYKKKISRGK